jgi:hypothetical protein
VSLFLFELRALLPLRLTHIATKLRLTQPYITRFDTSAMSNSHEPITELNDDYIMENDECVCGSNSKGGGELHDRVFEHDEDPNLEFCEPEFAASKSTTSAPDSDKTHQKSTVTRTSRTSSLDHINFEVEAGCRDCRLAQELLATEREEKRAVQAAKEDQTKLVYHLLQRLGHHDEEYVDASSKMLGYTQSPDVVNFMSNAVAAR